jgi:uncharacterized surface protein with fasciclin (FAS1) repeats
MNCRIIIASLFIFAIAEVAQGHKYYKRRYQKPAPVGDLVDVAVGAGAFTTLVKIVSDLGLVDTLKGVEAATVFAPTDAAFAKLPAGTLESLTADQAKAIVARHVIPGKLYFIISKVPDP